MNNIYILRMSICGIILICLQLLKNIHIIQLNSYNLDQNALWYKKNLASFLINVILLISCVLYYKIKFIPIYIVLVICLLGLLIENLPRKQKRKLVYTARIKRLIVLSLLIFAMFFAPAFIYRREYDAFYIYIAVALAPWLIFLAYLISLPFENLLRKKFMLQAKKIVDNNKNLYTIGITGSFGKTSVKYYLDKLLKIKYNTCMTPESFNTAMGATLTIKNALRNIDEIFICEMGARRIGDIKEICDILIPKGAILTDVGNMHLDTFKNIKNVRKCKFELIDSVYNQHINNNDKEVQFTNKNIVLVNGDNDSIVDKINEYNFSIGNVYRYGVSLDNDFYATNIHASSEGTMFDMICFNNDESKKKVYTFETMLLGLYNIKNLIAAIAYAILLDVDIDDIKFEVKKIEPVPHRLQLISNDKNNLIIDDAYNSNPLGARNAIDTIANFTEYIKIVITPGMVELGESQNKENESFAKYAGEKVDFAFVVGKTNKISLEDGFKKNLAIDKIIYFDKVEEAIFYARNNIDGKKVILLENDLSDNY